MSHKQIRHFPVLQIPVLHFPSFKCMSVVSVRHFPVYFLSCIFHSCNFSYASQLCWLPGYDSVNDCTEATYAYQTTWGRDVCQSLRRCTLSSDTRAKTCRTSWSSRHCVRWMRRKPEYIFILTTHVLWRPHSKKWLSAGNDWLANCLCMSESAAAIVVLSCTCSKCWQLQN